MAKLKKDSLLTTEHLQKLFPKKKSDITNAELLRIRRSMDDPEFDGYDLVQSLIDNQDVMNLHRCSFAQYTSAVKFCAYTMGGNVSAKDAYIRTFGHRDFVKDKMDLDKNSNKGKELSSAASRYSNSPLVQELARRESIAIYLSYRKQVHDAFGVLEDEMHNAPLSKDRIMAADRYIVHARPPEIIQIEANVNHSTGVDVQSSIMEQLESLASRQKQMFDSGISIEQIQKLGIKTEVIDVEIDDE